MRTGGSYRTRAVGAALSLRETGLARSLSAVYGSHASWQTDAVTASRALAARGRSPALSRPSEYAPSPSLQSLFSSPTVASCSPTATKTPAATSARRSGRPRARPHRAPASARRSPGSGPAVSLLIRRRNRFFTECMLASGGHGAAAVREGCAGGGRPRPAGHRGTSSRGAAAARQGRHPRGTERSRRQRNPWRSSRYRERRAGKSRRRR